LSVELLQEDATMLVLSRYAATGRKCRKDAALSEIVVDVPASDRPRKIVVTMIDIREDRGRIGVDADFDVKVHRREIHDEMTGDSKISIDAHGKIP
jgi:hypothetical protein